MDRNYYQILGVAKNASQEEIKKAFHKLAHQHHPDKNGGNEAKFKEINEAYQVLSNSEKRSQYDRFSAQGRGASGHGFDEFYRQQQSGFGNFSQGFNINMDDLGDMFGGFGDLFGFGSANRGRRHGGEDLELAVEISFAEAAFGVTKPIKFKKTVVCDHCRGNGAEPGSKLDECRTCRGSGKVTRIQRTILGAVEMATVCPDCQGRGKRPEKVCRECSGSGVNKKIVELEIKIPGGINDGERVRFHGLGEAGAHGAPAGDLFIRVHVRPDKRFARQGYDVYSELSIGFSEAALGGRKTVETLDGPVELEIPEGVQAGAILQLKEHGIVKLNSQNRGDQLVKILIKTPEKLSRAQKKLLEDLRKEGL